MATPTLTLTPNISGGVTQALNDRNPFVVDKDGFSLPIPQLDEEWASSVDTEGGRRVRSRPENPTGTIPLILVSTSASAMHTSLGLLQQTVEMCRRYGGILVSTPDGGTAVTYDLESIRISDLPQGEFVFARTRPVLEFTSRPYGRLTPVTIAAAQTSADPIQVVSLPDIPGSVDAWLEATITDAATQARDHLEVGLDDDVPAQAAYATTILADTPSLYWRLGTNGGTDSSGNGRTGTGGGGITIGGQAGALVGDSDGATDFDGTDDRVTSSYSPFVNGATQTFEGWAWRDTSTSIDVLFGSTGATPAYLRILANDTDIEWRPANNTATTWVDAWPGNNQWVHWALVFNETTNAVSLYINGSLVSASTNAEAYNAAVGNFQVGVRVTSTDAFDGKMDEVAVYATGLTATQIRNHYKAGRQNLTTPVLIDSADLSVSGLAGAVTTRTGAYNALGVVRATLATVPVGVCEATALNHRSRQRIKARVYASGTGVVYARVAYRIGSGPWTRGSWVSCLDDAFNEIDLGIVRPNADSGTLTVRVEAYSDTGGDTFDVDYLMLIPVVKWAKARGTTDFTTALSFTSRDLFNQTAGALAGKTADVGGVWSGAGDADDFAVETTGKTAQRIAVSDATPRFDVLGSAVTDMVVAADVKFSASTFGLYGVLARYVDTSNYFVFGINYGGVNATVVVGGAAYLVRSLSTSMAVGAFHSVKLGVGASGQYQAWINDALLFEGWDSVFASGGVLASGKGGLQDSHGTATANTRNYDNFTIATPDFQNVIASGGAVILDHESIARSDGTRPPSFDGSYLRVAPEGREGRTPRLVVKARRANVDEGPDTQIADAQSVAVTATPRVALLG